MHKYLKLLAILCLTTSCSITKHLETKKLENEFPEEPEIVEKEVYPLTDVKNPENFVKYYLRSKVSLYNANSLSSIAENNYKLALENPSNARIQEEAFILLLASQSYAKAITVAENKTTEEQMAFEQIFDLAQTLAKDENITEKLNNVLSEQQRLPFLKIIKAYLEYQKTKNIEQLKENILAINSSFALDGFKYYYIARAYEAVENYQEAFKLYNTAFNKYSLRTEEVFTRMVHVASKLEETDLDKLFNSNTKYGKNLYLVDQAFIDTSKTKELRNSVKDVAAQAFYDLGWSIVQTNPNLAGLSFLAISDYIVPADKTKFQLAKAYAANEWQDDAISLLEYIETTSEYYLSSQIVLADIVKKDNSARAINIIKDLQKNNRFNNYYLEAILGQIYLNNDQYNLALNSFNYTLEYDKSAKIYFSRAVVLEKLNKIELAIADLEEALKQNPKNPIVLNYLGYLLIDLKQQPAQGLEYIKQAVRLDPTSAASLDSLGWAYIKLGEYETGLALLERAYSIDIHDGVIAGHLADAYMLTNRKEEAIIYWEKALELEKDDKREIERVKQQLYKYNKAQ